MKNRRLDTLPARIQSVGLGLFGDRWATRLALAMGISRSQLYEYLKPRGGKLDRERNFDLELVRLIDRELERERIDRMGRDRRLKDLRGKIEVYAEAKTAKPNEETSDAADAA